MSENRVNDKHNNIKFLVMDVDGTLTDGKIYMSDEGELFKAFDIKDGCGIKEILPQYGIIPVIITARESRMLANRCIELGIKELHQGCREKLEKLKEIIKKYSVKESFNLENVAYVGDDLLDLKCMRPISAAGGMSVCPQNAIQEVQKEADFICKNRCGEGAVREFIDWLAAKIDKRDMESVRQVSEEAYCFINDFVPSKIPDGDYELANGVIAKVMTYVTKPLQFTEYESHRKYIDIQYIIFGEELMAVEGINNIPNEAFLLYDKEKDRITYRYDGGNIRVLRPGNIEIFYPQDAHRGGIAIEIANTIRKIVVKVPVIK